MDIFCDKLQTDLMDKRDVFLNLARYFKITVHRKHIYKFNCLSKFMEIPISYPLAHIAYFKLFLFAKLNSE